MRTLEEDLNGQSRRGFNNSTQRTLDTVKRTNNFTKVKHEVLSKDLDIINQPTNIEINSSDLEYVIDADTFKFKSQEDRIRLYGFDAPETSTESKITQFRKYGMFEEALELSITDSKSGDFFGDEATALTEKFIKDSGSLSFINRGKDVFGRDLKDLKNKEGELLSVELLRQGAGFTSLPGDRFFRRDIYSEQRIDAFIEAMENDRGIFSRKNILTPEYTRYLEKVGKGERASEVFNVDIRRKLRSYQKRKKFTKQGVTNADYLETLTDDELYFTIGASRGTSQHYQQSLYQNAMRQGGYYNLARTTPFEGVATSVLRTNTQLIYDEQADAGSLFIAQQFDKGLYTSGLGEYLNNKLFIPSGFGRAYKDETGFIGSIAGFAGRMLDESYLYYSNINPDIQLIGNEFEEGVGLTPMEAGRPGLFESTFTRAAEYTVAAAQSLGMYIAITQPIEMLKASVYKNTLDATLTGSVQTRLFSSDQIFKHRTSRLSSVLQEGISGFFFGGLKEREDILERMFEIDTLNERTMKLKGGEEVSVKQTAFFDHYSTSGSLFQSQQFLARGRAEIMLNATFRPLLTEVVNPYDISAIDPSTGSSYYKQYNKAVDNLINTISAPAGLTAQFSSGKDFTFKNITTDTIDVSFIGKTPGKTTGEGVGSTIVKGLRDSTGNTLNDRLTIKISGQVDPIVQDYKELRRQYTKIETELDKHIKNAYEELLEQRSTDGRNKASKKLYDLQQAKANVKSQLGEAFDSMNLTTTGIGTNRKRDIAKSLQGVLDYTPINPFKWGILSGGNLKNTAGTIMVGQLFSFDEAARMAEAAVTGDGALNQIFRKAQTSKLAELKYNVVLDSDGKPMLDADGNPLNEASINQYIRTYNLVDTINASMKTFDNINKGIFKSVKDFIFEDEDSKEAIIKRASRSLRMAEQKTVAKKGFWQKVTSGWLGDYAEIDKSAISVDKNYLKVNKRGRHIFEAIADFDEQLTRTNGINIQDLEKSLDTTGVRKLMRTSGEANIQGSINKILQGKNSNLAVEQVMNNRAKGLIAGLVFLSIAGNSIFQSTGGASLIAQAAYAVAGERADIAVEFEGNRFLPTEYFHSALEKTFGTAPSLMAINATAEVGFLGASLYAGYKIAQHHSYYDTIQYSYGIKELSEMSSEEGIRLVRKTSDLNARTATYSSVDLDDIPKAISELASDSINKGKLYVEIIQEGRNPNKYVAVDFNAGTKVFTTKKILQTVAKDVPINTMVYASVAMLAVGGLREVAANTLQLMAKTSGDPDDFVKDMSVGLTTIGTILSASYLGSSYLRKEFYDDVLKMGEGYVSNISEIEKAERVLSTEGKIMSTIDKRINNLTAVQEREINSKSPILKNSPKAKAIEVRDYRLKRLKANKNRYEFIIKKDQAFKNFLTTEDGKRYARLVDLDTMVGGRYKAFNQTATMASKLANFVGKNHMVIPMATTAITTAVLLTSLALKSDDTELDYSGSFDPLIAGAVGLGVGSLLTRSPALGLVTGVAAAAGAYLVNWAGISFLKVGSAGKTADEDKLRMTSQLAEFTKGVTGSLDEVNTFTISTSAYVSQFTNLGDKSIYDKSPNPFDKTKVIAKQVPLPMLQFFVAEKISGDYSTGGKSFDNETTQRTYSVGVQSGALFGMSMALELPVMYTPGRGFMNFSYNPEHNLDKLPNTLATVAAYSNIYMGTMATVGAVGSLLPGGVGRTFKQFSTGFGDFNKGVQNLVRNVNGFYIEQVSRTFVKLNLIDAQILIQNVSDKAYQDYKLQAVTENLVNTLDRKLAEHFGEGGEKALVVKGKALSGDELRLKNLSNLMMEGLLNPDDDNHRQVLQIITEEKKAFYTQAETRKIGKVERYLVDQRIGIFGYHDIDSYKTMNDPNGTTSYIGKITRFSRRHAFGAAKFIIAGTIAANFIGTAIANRTSGSLEEQYERKKTWERKKNLWIVGGGLVGGAVYGGYSVTTHIAKTAAVNFLTTTKAGSFIKARKSGLAQLGLFAAVGAYNWIKTSAEFGIARYMDRHIAYKPEGGLVRNDEGSILYEKNRLHQAGVTLGASAITLGAFYATSGPTRSLGQMADVFYDAFEGKTPTNVVGQIWERLGFGLHRRELAKLEIESVLGDVSRLQFNDLSEFNNFYNLEGTSNPLLASQRKAEIHLYELKDSIKKEFAALRGGIDPSEIPDDFVHKYLGIHQKMKAKAASTGQSLLDMTQYMSPNEAEEYKAFMKSVKGGINEFGVSNPGKILQQSKFTRGLARKAGATLLLMASVRVGLKILNDVTTDENARPGTGGFLDNLFAKADAYGMVGQNKIDGSGKVTFVEGTAAVLADIARLITGHDRIDIGVIQEQVNNRTQTTAITRQSLYGSSKDFKGASNFVQEFSAGFVLDDSNSYLALGSFGGITFRQGDKGFRTSTYFQLQSAGQDISTASYTMAAKFYHKTIAAQGVELSNIVDASARLLKQDGVSSKTLERTALLIRNITSMQTPLKNIRKITKSKGNISGDRLANLILNAREEAGRQLNRQSLSSIYTENYYNQVGNFQKTVGNSFFKDFMSRLSIGDEIANNLLGEILSGTFGYNPDNKSTITNIIFFQGHAGKMKKNQKGENIVVDELQGVNLSYQNAQYDQAQSKLLEYFDESFTALIDQGILKFLPDYVKETGQKFMIAFATFSALAGFGSFAGSKQFLDDAQNVSSSIAYKFTAHIDDGRAVNVSKEMVEKMNQARAQVGDVVYNLIESKVGTIPVQYNVEGGVGLEAYIKTEQAKDLELPAGHTRRSVNQILHERVVANGEWYGESLGRGNRAVITATDMENSVSYRFAISEAIQFAEEGTLEKITETLSKNSSFGLIDKNSIHQSYDAYLISQKQVLLDFDGFARQKMFGEVNTFHEFVEKVAGTTNKAELSKATSQLNQVVRQRLVSTYDTMAENLFGGGFNTDGSLDFTKNRYTEIIQMKPVGDIPIRSHTVYEIINGTFSDEEILSELRTNSEIVEAIKQDVKLKGGDDVDNLLGNSRTLDDLGDVNSKYIERARQELVQKELIGTSDAPGKVTTLKQKLSIKIDDELGKLGLELGSKNGQATIAVNGLDGRRVVLKPGNKNFEEAMARVTYVTEKVRMEVDTEGLLQSTARNLGTLQTETANQAGFVQRNINRMLGKGTQTSSRKAMRDVAQFRGMGAQSKGFGRALAGLPVAAEVIGTASDVVAAVNLYGAYARVAESLSDPMQTQQDVEMAKRELGQVFIKSIGSVLLSIVSTKIMGGMGWIWKKTNMSIAKFVVGGAVLGTLGGLLGGAVYKGAIKPALQATKSMINESDFLKDVGDKWTNTWNVVGDYAGYTLAMPVEMAHKYGTKIFGEGGGKKAAFTTAGALGAAGGMGMILAGLAFSSFVTLTAPVSLALLGTALVAGAGLGFIFGDQNATVSTKLLNEIPKIPIIGGLLGSMIDSPYRSIRSQRRFRHFYRHSPFTVGYAADIVNQKWMSTLSTVDDPTGADLVSNMFGEIIRPTEYHTSAWRINSSSYAPSPIPIVDGVIERELRIRAQRYSDLIIGRHQWENILKYSDQNAVVKSQIAAAKQREAAILKEARRKSIKAAQGGGATSVPNHAGGSAAAPNNHEANMKIASEEIKTAVLTEAQKEAAKPSNISFKVSMNVEDLNNDPQQFTRDNLNKTINRGNVVADIPGNKYTRVVGEVVASNEGIPIVSVRREEDYAFGVVRDASIRSATEGEIPSPESYIQGRVAVMSQNIHGTTI